MKLVKQKASACVPTAIFMLNNNKDFRKIKNMCKKRFRYSHTRGDGCTIKGDGKMTVLLSQLGMSVTEAPSGNFSDFGSLSGYNRGLIMIRFDNDRGHCAAWDGYRVFDPFQDKIISEFALQKIYGGEITYSLYIVKTNLFVRLMNAFKKPFFELRCKCESIRS